jgi:hypothetical protein
MVSGCVFGASMMWPIANMVCCRKTKASNKVSKEVIKDLNDSLFIANAQHIRANKALKERGLMSSQIEEMSKDIISTRKVLADILKGL